MQCFRLESHDRTGSTARRSAFLVWLDRLYGAKDQGFGDGLACREKFDACFLALLCSMRFTSMSEEFEPFSLREDAGKRRRLSKLGGMLAILGYERRHSVVALLDEAGALDYLRSKDVHVFDMNLPAPISPFAGADFERWRAKPRSAEDTRLCTRRTVLGQTAARITPCIESCCSGLSTGISDDLLCATEGKKIMTLHGLEKWGHFWGHE